MANDKKGATATCGRPKTGQVVSGRAEGEKGLVKPSPSFTTLSTIAVQSGRSQVVVSVLKSGSLIHLQLVQIHPGLCEIGMSRHENETMIREQQQLMEKLKKHEGNVLAVVENRQTEKKEREKEEGVSHAMVGSLSEGWSLLLRLLERRERVLTLASEFFCRAQEFGADMDKAEDLQTKPGDDGLAELQLTYSSMHTDLLGKSLQVVTSSSVLLQKLRQLQRTERLQRTGGVLQDHEEEEESCHHSRGVVLKLEEMVEMLQDRRRKVDQALRLQLQQVSNNREESRWVRSDQWGAAKTLDHIQQTGFTSGESSETRHVQLGSRAEESRVPNSGPRSDSEDSQLESAVNVQTGSTSEETTDPEPGARSDLKSGSQSQAEGARASELSRKRSRGATEQVGKETRNTEDHTHQTLLTNQRRQLLLSSEQLLDKVWTWVQQGSRLLSHSCEAGLQLPEAEDALNVLLQLHTQAESVGHDAENLRQVLDQIAALRTDPTSSTSRRPSSEPSPKPSPLKALTEQLKSSSGWKQATRSSSRQDPLSHRLRPGLAGRADVALNELQNLTSKIDLNLQLLRPYVTFLRMAQQVEEELEELKEMCNRRPEEEEESESGCGTVGSPEEKKQQTLQRFHMAQKLGNKCVRAVTMVSRSALNLRSLVPVVQQTLERLSTRQQEVNALQTQQQIQIRRLQEDIRFYRKCRERLFKTQQDLKSVSQLLDSCTLMDLGSDLQTSRLLERFIQARPHFIQLDAEVENMLKSWDTLKTVQERWKVNEVKAGALSELQELQNRVKDKIQQSEFILELTVSFHLTARQLEALLQSDPVSHLPGPSEAELGRLREERQQIQGLLKTALMLKTEICSVMNHIGWTCFSVEQLEARLLSLDSLCSSWLNEAARREEGVRRRLLTNVLRDDIILLCDSFTELKERFSNMKFNYAKRNNSTRNMKAVRNQLQQVELHQEKLQGLGKRLQALKSRLASDAKDRAAAREPEDAINELQRQMDEFGRSVRKHQKTLAMTWRLQQAMDEYQSWCEEASETIARVVAFSWQCRSTGAASVLYRQFEEFVWPTVPQQEERISQITELAVGLHGLEDGRRYVEKMVSKHSQMMESIRKLSDGLMTLEAKLKLKDDGEKELNEKQKERDTRTQDEEKDRKLKEHGEMEEKEQTDDHNTQESADVYELKETGHTPELTPEHDGSETAANQRQLQAADGRTDGSESSHREQLYSKRFTSSCFSTPGCSLSHPPVEADRRVRAIRATARTSVIGPSFSDIQREFQGKEMQQTAQDVSAGGQTEVELQQQDVVTEDYLSSDECECVSPDDISLPPLAETPESNVVQSDIEDSFCFSCQSVHIHHHHAQSEHRGSSGATGAVQKQMESSETECGLNPPTSLHSSTRFRSESSSFVQCPFMVSAPSRFSNMLCSILRTEETISTNAPQRDDLSLGNVQQSFTSGSNPVHRSNTPDRCYNGVPERRSYLQTDHLSTEPNNQRNQPQRNSDTQAENTPNDMDGILPKSDPVIQHTDLMPSSSLPTSSYKPQPVLNPTPGYRKDEPYSLNPNLHKGTITFPQDNSFTESSSHSESGLKHKINSKSMKQTCSVFKSQRDDLTSTTTATQQSINFKAQGSTSSPQVSPCHQSKTMPQMNTALQTHECDQSPIVTFSDLSEEKTHPQENGPLISYPTCLQTTTTIPQITTVPQPYSSHCSLGTSRSILRTHTESPFSIDSRDLADVQVPFLPEQNSINNKISSSTIINSNIFISTQSHQTVCSFHESLTSTSSSQCVHDPDMTSSSLARPAAPPQPGAQTKSWAQQANMHVNPQHHSSSPLHLLTPDKDSDTCQPLAVHMEILLTPRIPGPSLSAPLSHVLRDQIESLPQRTTSNPGPSCFTMPTSRATVMEGSPVTLEVEVTGQSQPTLTWFKDGEVSADGKHFPIVPQASDSDGGLIKARAAEHHDSQLAAGSSSGSDKWLLAEVLDAISVDWQTWLGTLCVLLWLLYLIIL